MRQYNSPKPHAVLQLLYREICIFLNILCNVLALYFIYVNNCSNNKMKTPFLKFRLLTSLLSNYKFTSIQREAFFHWLQLLLTSMFMYKKIKIKIENRFHCIDPPTTVQYDYNKILRIFLFVILLRYKNRKCFILIFAQFVFLLKVRICDTVVPLVLILRTIMRN